MPSISDIRSPPWQRGSWHGRFLSIDGTHATDFSEDEIDELLAYANTGLGWDGDEAGILRLKDGRIVSWESSWGPTGDGFHMGAYGGDADICFAETLEMSLRGLSEGSLDLLASQLPPHVNSVIRLAGGKSYEPLP